MSVSLDFVRRSRYNIDMDTFENKKILVIADSNLTNSFFLEYLRSSFVAENKRVYMFNGGIPGARMDMVMNCVEEEISVEKPDCALLSFGGNDLGVWLYDSTLEVTEAVLKERAERNQSYANALKEVIDYLRLQKIEPILMTPMCYDENLVESEEITTDKDNKEKMLIGDSFFKRATFKNINQGLKDLRDIGVQIAREKGIAVWDIFTETHERVDHSCFIEDGVHYNEKGHWIMAELFYKHMFGAELKAYPIPESVKEISVLEADERAYFFAKYNIVFLSEGRKDGEALVQAVQSFIERKGYEEGLTKERADGFFRFVKAPFEKQKEIARKIKRLYEV